MTGIETIAEQLSDDGGIKAAKAIMTTDLIEKALPGRQFDSKIQTKPLDPTPMPSKQLSQAQNVDPITRLTSTETALLSPTEKVIASRT